MLLAAAPVSALVAALAQPLIAVVYGNQWISAAPVLSILSIYGTLFVVGLLYANFLIAVGDTGILLGVQVVALVELLPLMWLGVSLLGAEGVALAHVLVILLITLPVYAEMLRRRTGTSPLLLVRSAARPVLAALVCAAIASTVSSRLSMSAAQLILGALAGGLAYALIARARA